MSHSPVFFYLSLNLIARLSEDLCKALEAITVMLQRRQLRQPHL
jgi:hypothetical protein